MNHLLLSVKSFPFHSALTCLLPVLLIPANINEIRDNNIHANINEICDNDIHAAFSTFHFAGLGCILVVTFLLSCRPTYQILSQVWAKPQPSLSFDL
jgi:hypothetical protein